jgi:hypothetical protein
VSLGDGRGVSGGGKLGVGQWLVRGRWVGVVVQAYSVGVGWLNGRGCAKFAVLGGGPRGRPRGTRTTALIDDMRRGVLSPEYATDRGLWRRIYGAKLPTRVNLDIQ